MAKVVLAMSGGVDSSVAAHLLLEQGHDVVGVFMRHGEKSVAACSVDGSRERSPLLPVVSGRTGHKQGCCSVQDADDARDVAQRLGVPFYALNLQAEFRGIIDYFVDEYARGRTPNPCVMCNNRIKFGKLFDYADSVGASHVATGHYARLVAGADGPELFRGVDAGKDQSYVLFGIQRRLLGRMLLPVGEYEKPAIRELAGQIGLNVAEKKDSQEICFVTSGHHGEFVRARRGDGESSAGPIVTTDGRVVGQHEGYESFTVGQRKGLGVALGEPWFVVRIDPERRAVILGRKDELGCRRLTADGLNWLEPPAGGVFRCLAQIRYNSTASAATAEVLADSMAVSFDEPQAGVAPGQAVVLYRGDRVLGGGWIRGTES